MAMMAITTNNSISVNARPRRGCSRFCIFNLTVVRFTLQSHRTFVLQSDGGLQNPIGIFVSATYLPTRCPHGAELICQYHAFARWIPGCQDNRSLRDSRGRWGWHCVKTSADNT